MRERDRGRRKGRNREMVRTQGKRREMTRDWLAKIRVAHKRTAEDQEVCKQLAGDHRVRTIME